MRTIAGWLQERFISDPERVRPHLIFDPELVAVNKGRHAGEPEHTLIKGSGTRQIRGWIDDESKFDDFHWLTFVPKQGGPRVHNMQQGRNPAFASSTLACSNKLAAFRNVN